MKNTKKMLTSSLIAMLLLISFCGNYVEASFKLAKDTKGKYHRIVGQNKKIDSRITALSNFMKRNKDKKRKTMFALVPPSVKKGVTKLPQGVKDYSNELSDKMLKELKAKKLNTYDLRVPFKNTPISSMYYKRDHHWTQKAALDASNLIAKKLNTVYKTPIPNKSKFSSTKNYTKITHKKVYKGSFSTLYGKTKALKEDFSVFAPKWKTSFTLKGYDKNGKYKKTISGKNFMDTFINKNNFNSKVSKYYCFLNGYNAQSVVYNNNAGSKSKVLVLSTSLGRTAIPYIANYFKEVHFIDSFKTKININKYADKIKPDIVIVLYSASSFAKEACFQFN